MLSRTLETSTVQTMDVSLGHIAGPDQLGDLFHVPGEDGLVQGELRARHLYLQVHSLGALIVRFGLVN